MVRQNEDRPIMLTSWPNHGCHDPFAATIIIDQPTLREMVQRAMTESKSQSDNPRMETLAALGGARRAGPTAQDEAYEIHIARDGTWYYHGSPIGRPALVKLFATVLRRDEAGDYWLVTPAERGRITVEDAPFVAVAVEITGEGRDQALTFRTNLDHQVTADAEHPLRVVTDPVTGAPSPYILVRNNLEARINRPVFYELVNRAGLRDSAEQPEQGAGASEIGIWSKGTFFPLGTVPAEA